MPHHVFTREALYERVWTAPIRTAARELGVSDVGLAKACRRSGIPLPPRGYWTQRRHGRPTPARPSLRPLCEAAPDRVVIAPAPPRVRPSAAVEAIQAAALEERPVIAVSDRLRRPHPIVQGWVASAARQRREACVSEWGLETLADLNAPLARRRLCLTSALLTALEDRGLTVGQDGQWLVAAHEPDRVRFRLYERQRIERRPATPRDQEGDPSLSSVRVCIPAGDLAVSVRDWLSIPRVWRELRAPLEAQLPAIAAALEAGVAEQGERRLERDLAAERQALRERDQRRRAEDEAAARARLQQLVDQAEAYRQAEAIRALVAAADQRGAPPGEPGTPDPEGDCAIDDGLGRAVSAADCTAWRAWALAQAARLDPLINGAVPLAPRMGPGRDEPDAPIGFYTPSASTQPMAKARQGR